MPYDFNNDAWRSKYTASTGLGRTGALITPNDSTDLAKYARVRVYTPSDASSPVIKIIPVENDDASPITLNLIPGTVTILEYIVRRVYSTGTTGTLVCHTVL